MGVSTLSSLLSLRPTYLHCFFRSANRKVRSLEQLQTLGTTRRTHIYSFFLVKLEDTDGMH